ncbi:MAG: metallophosphoesterase [Candidatus Paceibacterota bacterium]|jgi:hypothetical protein
MNTRFLIVSIVLFIIILVSEYVAYASLHYAGIIKSSKLEVLLMLLGVILPIIFIYSMLYSYKHYSLFNSWINSISSVWLGIILYVFIASLIVFLLIMLNLYFDLQIPIKIISNILLVFIISLITYGVINASNPRIVRWTVVSEKLSQNWSDKKIVIISDVHLGSIRKEGFLKKIISKIENENPDVVFILGDLIDGPSFPYEKWFKEFSVLKPQFGILYVEGNHEKYSQEYDKFKSQLPSSINNLTDKKVIINNTQIIGLDYKESKSPDEINKELEYLRYDKNQPSIILMHDPKNTEDLSKMEVSLVLSGHTHSGQFFPFTTLVNSIYKKYSHGVSYTDKTASLTSAGVGTSIIPIRIETTPEIIVLKIK